MGQREVRDSGHHGGSPWWGREKSEAQATMVGGAKQLMLARKQVRA